MNDFVRLKIVCTGVGVSLPLPGGALATAKLPSSLSSSPAASPANGFGGGRLTFVYTKSVIEYAKFQEMSLKKCV